MASDIYLKVGELFAKWFKMRIAGKEAGTRYLVNPEQARFETAPIGVLIRLVPEAYLLSRGVDGGGDVFAPPSLTDQPGLVEESDCALGIDFAHDVNPSRTQRQAPLGNQLRQRRGNAAG